MTQTERPEAAPQNAQTLRARRVDAARHLLHPHHFRNSLRVSPQPSIRNASLAGLQAAVTIAIAIPAFYLSPWSDLAGFAALGALVALFGRFSPQRGRGRVLMLVALSQTLAVFFMTAAVYAGVPVIARLMLLALACGGFYFASVTFRFGPPGALIFIFAAGAAMAPVEGIEDVLERTAATGLVAVLAWVICALTERFRHHETAERPFPADQVPPLRPRMISAGRIMLGSGGALFASHALGVSHPSWAAMGALAVMQGAHLQIHMSRALQRMAGTVVGAILAWLILSQAPAIWVVVLLLIALQFLTEIVIGMNYGFGLVLVTPMALLMTHLGAPDGAGMAMVPERVLDTVLGASVGIVFAVILSTLDDRHHLAQLHGSRNAS